MTLPITQVVIREDAGPAAFSGPRMTFDRFKTIADHVDMRMWPAKMEFEVTRRANHLWPGMKGVRVRLTYHVIERSTGKLIPLYFDHGISCEELEVFRDEDALKFFHREIRFAVLHELDECFLVCGKRVFDPHGTDPSTVTLRQAERFNARDPWTLPDPLPPKLPRDIVAPPGERIKIGGPVPRLLRLEQWGQSGPG